MVGTLKDLSDTTFNISDVLPRYRLERLGNSYFLKVANRSISSTGEFSKCGKTLYIRNLVCGSEDLGDRAFSDTPESITEKSLDLTDKSLYSKAWCCDESE